MKITNEQAADLVGLSVSGVSRIRSGDRFPNWETMARIEQAIFWPVADQVRAKQAGSFVETFERRLLEVCRRGQPAPAPAPAPVPAPRRRRDRTPAARA